MSGEALIIDGFDYYPDVATTSYGVQANWTGAAGAMVTGRFAGLAYQPNNNNISTHQVVAAQTSFSFGFAMKLTTLSASTPGFFGWQTGATAQGYLNLSNGFLQIRRGSNTGTVLGTAVTGQLATATWYYIEVEMVLHASAGTVNVYANGILVLALTGQNTLNSGTTADTFIIGSNQLNASGFTYDDLYVRNGATRYGEAKIETLRAASDVSVTWTPSSGANNYSRVNETLVDGDSSYVSSATINQIDLYSIGSLSSNPATVFAVQQKVCARKDDAATRTISDTFKSGAVTTQGTNWNLGASYVYHVDIYDTDPNTGGAWTYSAVNALNIGQKMIA
jgi:hypothetical protein